MVGKILHWILVDHGMALLMTMMVLCIVDMHQITVLIVVYLNGIAPILQMIVYPLLSHLNHIQSKNMYLQDGNLNFMILNYYT